MPSSPSTRSVRISSSSELFVFKPVSGVDVFSKFCSSRENRRSEQEARLRAARDASQIMAMMVDGPPADISHETLCKSVGIEKLIWPPEGGARECRRDHVRAVVSRQYNCTAKELSRVSQESSSMAGKTAQRLAASYWNDLKV